MFQLNMVFALCLSAHYLHGHHGHHGPTYHITSPLTNKEIKQYILLDIMDAHANIPIPARFSLIANQQPYVPDSLDENGIRFKSIHTGKNEIFVATYSRGTGPVFIPLPDNVRNGIVFVSKGYEYLPEKVDFNVEKSPLVTIQMKRWIHLEKEGWLAADEHLHYDRIEKSYDPDWLTMLEADGLAYGHFLVLKGGNLPGIWASQYAYGKDGEASNGKTAIYPGEEYRDRKQGHINLLGINSIIHPIIADTKDYPYNHPSFYDIFQKTHELGGIGGPAHGTKLGQHPTGILDVILGATDFFEILNTGIKELDAWYRLMNCGYFMPPAAGTDLPNWPFRDGWQPFFGETRMYVKMDRKRTDFQSWKNALKKGKVFVTSGPIIKLQINDAEMGDILPVAGNTQVDVKARVQCTQPLQSLEIIQNGEVIGRSTHWDKEDNVYTISLHKSVKINKSSWIAARAEGFYKQALFHYRGDKENIFAHTAPIQILVRHQPVFLNEDAQWLKAFLQDQKEYYDANGNFEEETYREQMMALFDQAIDTLNGELNRHLKQ